MTEYAMSLAPQLLEQAVERARQLKAEAESAVTESIGKVGDSGRVVRVFWGDNAETRANEALGHSQAQPVSGVEYDESGDLYFFVI